MSLKSIVAASAVFLLSANANAWRSDLSDSKWRSGWGQGIAEAQVTHGAGNELYVTCSAGKDDSSHIWFIVARDSPKPHSTVYLRFDNGPSEEVSVNAEGFLDSSSRASSLVFEHLINQFKTHARVAVRFSTGRAATFTLKGAAKAIGECPSDFSPISHQKK